MYFVCVISVSAERYDPEADEDDGEKRVSYDVQLLPYTSD